MVDTSSSTLLDTDEAAVRNVPQRIVDAWADNDAEAFAAVFTEDGSLILPGDIYLKSRAEVRDFMSAAFSGPYKGTRVFGTPLAVKTLGAGVALVLTQGGVLAPEETVVPPEHGIRASWLLTKVGPEWLITAYQNTPIPAA